MAHTIILDADDETKKRTKICWEVRDISGRRRRKSKTFKPGTPQREIRKFINQVELEYANDLLGRDYTKRTLGEWAEQYLELFTHNLSPTTISNHRQMISSPKHGIVANLGEIRLDKLSTLDCQRYCQYLINEGLSSRTVRNYMTFLHTLLAKAQKIGYLAKSNVVDAVELPKKTRTKIEVYTPEEINKILSRIRECGSELLLTQTYILIYTGMRRSEASALLWSDINMSQRTISINKAKIKTGSGKEDMVKETKTFAGERIIPIADELYAVLRKAYKQYQENRLAGGKNYNQEGYVLCDELGNPYKVDSISMRWTKFMRRNPDLPYLSVHKLRHCFASLLVESGADLKAIQTLMGHENLDVTLQIYSHSNLNRQKECIDGLNEMIALRKQA